MKSTGSIFLVLAVLFFSSCLADWEEPVMAAPEETGGVMQVTVSGYGGETEDKIQTVRFIVFKNVPSSPQLELNQLFTVPSDGSGQGEASKFDIILEVSRKVSGPNDKIVVAIVNEPSSMTTGLENISSYNQLHNLELDFAGFLNNDHRTLKPNEALPMTGMIRTDKVYATVAEAEADRAELTLERAVARVEVYLRKELGGAIDITTASKVELKNTYTKEYFLYHTDGSSTFGQIQTVLPGSLTTKAWNPATAIPDATIPDTGDGLLLCSFYTPERTCIAPGNADKLIVNMELVTDDGSVRSGEVILDTATKEGESQPTPLTEIRRNNSYKIVATAESNAAKIKFTIVYVPWEMSNQSITFD